MDLLKELSFDWENEQQKVLEELKGKNLISFCVEIPKICQIVWSTH